MWDISGASGGGCGGGREGVITRMCWGLRGWPSHDKHQNSGEEPIKGAVPCFQQLSRAEGIYPLQVSPLGTWTEVGTTQSKLPFPPGHPESVSGSQSRFWGIPSLASLGSSAGMGWRQ